MNCPRCNGAVTAEQRFCERCGSVLSSASGAPAAVAVAVAAPQGGEVKPHDGLVELVPGSVVGGKYTIQSVLGEGGMGCVYAAEQKLGATKRKVAIKTLHLHLSRDEKLRARFEREVSTVAGLEHPHTIQVFDFGTTPEGLLYIVMELAVGRSLGEVLTTEIALQPERAINILTQISGALSEAHKFGIVHRDLKPDNIMLTERAGQHDFVKVLDFGIAKKSGSEDARQLTQQGTVLGTPPYMSPEQFTGDALDGRSDIYSLGVMAYEMVIGRLPFDAKNPWEWAQLHLTKAPAPFDQDPRGRLVPPAMREAIFRALRKNRNERFATAEEFASALRKDPSPRAAGTHDFHQKPGEIRPGGTLVGDDVAPIVGPAAAYGYPSGTPERGITEQTMAGRAAGSTPPPAYAIPYPTAHGSATAGQVGYPYAPGEPAAEPMQYADTSPMHAGRVSPGAFPAPPPKQIGGGSRAGIFVVLIGIAVLSMSAIGYSLMPSSGGNTPPAGGSDVNGSGANLTVPATTAAPNVSTPIKADPGLTNLDKTPQPGPGQPVRMSPQSGPQTGSQTGSQTSHSPATTTPAMVPPPLFPTGIVWPPGFPGTLPGPQQPTQTQPQTPTQPTPARPDPIPPQAPQQTQPAQPLQTSPTAERDLACASARRAKLKNAANYDTLAQHCIALGGTP